MHAEFPPDFPVVRVIETIIFYEPVDCMMWRMGGHCPNTTDQGILCEDANKRRFALAQCPLCAQETQMDIVGTAPLNIVIADQQLSNRVLARFEFAPEYRQRIAISDVTKVIGEAGRTAEMRIASILKAYGATKEQTRNGARWNGLRWRI